MRMTLMRWRSLLIGPRLYVGIAVAAVILLVAFSVFSGGPADTRRWVKAVKGEFSIELIETGDIRSTFSYDVKAPMVWGSLQIMELIPEGTIVKPGDVLVKFDPSYLIADLQNTRERMEQNEAELLALDTEQNIRYAEMEKNMKTTILSRELAELKKESVRFESELQKRQAELEYQRQMLTLDEAETRLKNQKIIDQVARLNVTTRYEYSKLWVERLQSRITEFTIKSPTTGMVVYREVGGHGSPRRKIQIGDKPWPSQPIISIPDPAHMEAVVRVNEVDAGKITMGDRVGLSLDAFEQSVYKGEVMTISRLADKRNYSSQIKDFEVVVKIADPDSMLKPGMTVRARINLGRIPEAVYLPAGAVFETADGKTVVFKRKNPQKSVPVITGRRNDRFIIIAEGVRQGEEIALSPLTGSYFPLGRAREMERRAKELAMLMATPDSAFTLESRVFKSDSDSSKTAPPPAAPPNGGSVIIKPSAQTGSNGTAPIIIERAVK